jgi:uncharacterized protein with GYD domain
LSFADAFQLMLNTVLKSAFRGVQFRDIGDPLAMPTYIVLSKWTPQGLQNIKQSPTRLDAARKEYEAAGVKWKDFYMVTGQYDMVAIVDAPDDVTLAKAILSSTSHGSITTQTCRAFTEQEYRNIIGALG